MLNIFTNIFIKIAIKLFYVWTKLTKYNNIWIIVILISRKSCENWWNMLFTKNIFSFIICRFICLMNNQFISTKIFCCEIANSHKICTIEIDELFQIQLFAYEWQTHFELWLIKSLRVKNKEKLLKNSQIKKNHWLYLSFNFSNKR